MQEPFRLFSAAQPEVAPARRLLRGFAGADHPHWPQIRGQNRFEEHWKTITTAIGNRCQATGKYRNRDGEIIKAELAPLAVWFTEGSYLLLAAGAADGKLRVWRPDRFTELRLDQGRSAPEIAEAEIEAAIRNSFKGYVAEPVEIRLRVRPTSAYMFHEFQYHPSQRIKELEDGGLGVSLNCATGWGLEEWRLGFGELVTVEQPPELRQRLTERIGRMLAAYQANLPA